MSAPDDRPTARSLGWQTRSSKKLHTSHWFDISQDELTLPDGSEAIFTYVEHPGAVFVIPFTSGGDLILLRSFRYPIDQWCIEVPAGGVGDKPGASLEEVAREELLEEIGCVAGELVRLGEFWMANGFARNRSVFFAALDATVQDAPSPELTEQLSPPEVVSKHAALEMIRTGEFNDGDSAFAVMLALDMLERRGRGS